MVYQNGKEVAISKAAASNTSGSGVRLESISIITPPKKVLYMVGETFDPDGMEVEGNFSNGKTVYIKLTDLVFSPSGPLEDGTEAVQVILDWGSVILSASQDISVGVNLEWWTPKMTSNTTPQPYAVSAVDSYTSAFAPWKAFDNNKSTCWASNITGLENWIMFDFGVQALIYGISITPAPEPHTNGFPLQFDFQGSNDANEWVTIFHGDVSEIPTEPVSFYFGRKGPYRYYRLTHMVYYIGDMSPRIGEIMFFMPTTQVVQSDQFEFDLFQEVTTAIPVTTSYTEKTTEEAITDV